MATSLFRNCHSRPPLCHQSELRGHVWELEGLRWVLAPSPLPRRYWGFRSLESYAPHYPFLLHHHRDHKIMPPAAWLERGPSWKTFVEGTGAQRHLLKHQLPKVSCVSQQSSSKSVEDESRQPQHRAPRGHKHNGQDPGNPGGPWATTEALIEWPFPAAPLPLIVFWWNKNVTGSSHGVT